MTSRSVKGRPTGSGQSMPPTAQSPTDVSQTRDPGLNRPLPPLPPSSTTPSSSLPNSYDIPALRRKPVPQATQTTSLRHNRSVSQPFPVIFGGRRQEKKNHPTPRVEHDSSDDGRTTKPGRPRNKGQQPPSGANLTRSDSQPATGKCMTCASTVRWPHGLKVFRCTTCLTINDLEPSNESEETIDDHGLSPRGPVPISLERTKKLISQCLETYLQQQMDTIGIDTGKEAPTVGRVTVEDKGDTGARKSSRPPDNSSNPVRTFNEQIPPDAETRPVHLVHATPWKSDRPFNLEEKNKAQSYQMRPATQSADGRAAHRPSEPETDNPPYIFRAVEYYIQECCTGCTILNASFFSNRTDTNVNQRPDPQRLPRSVPETSTTPQFEPDFFMSEFDAKTLLLGDVVENGSWWTGKASPRNDSKDRDRGRSPERRRGIVSMRTPRINWMELAEWYRLIIHAGDDWKRRWDTMLASPSELDYQSIAPRSVERIQRAFTESQLHLHRALLKSTENLLKRPRRPLNAPEDSRFLLMLLANPLLYSSSERGVQTELSKLQARQDRQPPNVSSNLKSSPSKRPLHTSSRSGALGHHSGILKRVFGLLSNLSDDNHQFLVSWTSRFSDNHFQRTLEIVSSFITYRLSRQQDRASREPVNPIEGLVPSFSNASGARHASQLHAALELRPSTTSKNRNDGKPRLGVYSEDWQVKAAARFMAILFHANTGHSARKRDMSISTEQRIQSAGLNAKYQAYSHGQIVPISNFYNTMLDHADLIGDFEAWETTRTRFTFCQYPFFLSIWAKIRILEHDARRQMEVKAREAFFDSILSHKAVSQYLVLKVRRDCLVDDSLRGVSEVVGSGGNDIKKGLRIDFVGEEGVDAGGLRKEWFLLLVREIFDPRHGLFLYDDDSQYCYFNPYCFESSEQFFLVGVLLGLAIYNSTILDIAFPPFVFKKMLAAAPPSTDKLTSAPKIPHSYTLEDLAEYRPALAKGLRQLLDFEGDVQETFCRDFCIEVERYGENVEIPLCNNGHKRAVTNSNRKEFVDLYVRYMLDTAVARQFEPFKRGFFSVCGGNALSLFRPEEIELLIRGSDEPLDIRSLQAVATYDNWPKEDGQPEEQQQVLWFWETFEQANPADQRRMLGFITGSDRIPAMGATNLVIRLQLIRDPEIDRSDEEVRRFPIARTCFNTLGLHRYKRKTTLETKLWMAVRESEGFGLK